MAHFAKINNSNIVEQVIVVSNDVATTEQAGVDFINNLYKTNDVWKQTYVDKSLRKNFASINYIYNQTLDAFIPPRPFESWLLNEETCQWEAPIAYPNNGQDYDWNDQTQQWDLIDKS